MLLHIWEVVIAFPQLTSMAAICGGIYGVCAPTHFPSLHINWKLPRLDRLVAATLLQAPPGSFFFPCRHMLGAQYLVFPAGTPGQGLQGCHPSLELLWQDAFPLSRLLHPTWKETPILDSV